MPGRLIEEIWYVHIKISNVELCEGQQENFQITTAVPYKNTARTSCKVESALKVIKKITT